MELSHASLSHVGDQFCSKNKHLISKVFGWFYFSINFGAFASGLMTPFLLKRPEKKVPLENGFILSFGIVEAQRIVRANLWPSLLLRASWAFDGFGNIFILGGS